MIIKFAWPLVYNGVMIWRQPWDLVKSCTDGSPKSLQSALCLRVCKSNDTLYYCILYISDIVRRQSQSHILEMGMEILMIGMTWKPSVTHMSLAVMPFEETFVCQETIMAPFDCCQIPVPERWTRQPSGRTAFGERSLAPLAKRTKVPGASSSMESVKMKLHSWFQVKIP